jgi:putative SOS response-associated peptidase YedK
MGQRVGLARAGSSDDEERRTVAMLDGVALFWVKPAEVGLCCHTACGESPIPPASTPFDFSANLSSGAGNVCLSATRTPSTDHVWAGHPERRTDTLWHHSTQSQTGEVSLDPLRWGLIPFGARIRTGGRKPINAKCETLDRLPMFRDAYRRRRCILPVDGFYEWKEIRGQKAKQPYAIAMKDGKPFGIGALWENWKDPASGEWIRTFAVITTDANELVAEIHDRMPLILTPGDYNRWLSEEPDPRDLLRPFPAEPMRMWPISTRVDKPENDERSLLDAVVGSAA